MRRFFVGSCTLSLAALAALTALTAVACNGSEDGDGVATAPASSATDGGSTSSSSSGNDAKAGSPASSDAALAISEASVGDAAESNCVAKTYGGNEKKVGAYCDEHTSCPFQVDPFLICTFGHDPTNTHLFCTTPCSKDAECGTNAFCVHYTSGSGCVPAQCGGTSGS